ncbi:MAG: hypothetical protein CL946_11710 [Ectothiorhodospiraceae bacterium]|nr:hypothetical protein [Ectothiorhodospiraceae bacterium]
MTDCAIIGGGVAGLTAAVQLARARKSVSLFESSPKLGGRAFGFEDAKSGIRLDNGQHILMGCYTSLLSLLNIIGSADRLTPVRNMRLPFRAPGGEEHLMQALPLPYPLGQLSAFLRFSPLSLRERIRALRVPLTVLFGRTDSGTHLDSIPASEWLAQLGQTSRITEFLWKPLILATMNAVPEQTSAGALSVVLREAFLAGAKASEFLVPDTDLSSVIADPAERYLRESGAELHIHNRVKAVSQTPGGWQLQCADGSLHQAKTVVSAMPAGQLTELLSASNFGNAVTIDVERFQPSPIASYYTWTTKPACDDIMVGCFRTTLQWVFPKGELQDGTWLASWVISAADELAEHTSEDVDSLLRSEVVSLFPHLDAADIVRTKLITERSATFVPAPGLSAFRPVTETALPGFFLAGDWTATGYPATLEGAAKSGYRAAESVMKCLG